MKNILNTQKKKSFRLSSKKILLTYSQIDGEVSKEEVLEQLERKLGKFDYIICKENHKNGGTHFHVVLIHRNKLCIRNPFFLDLQLNGQIIHGNYETVKNLNFAVSYACKNDDYITNIDRVEKGELLNQKEFICKQVELKGENIAMLEFLQKNPNTAMSGMSLVALDKHFNALNKITTSIEMDKIETPFTLDNFNTDPILTKWMENPLKTLFLVGMSGIGKTQFFKTYVKHKNFKTLMVNHKEDFARLNNSYDCIIIDDANIHEFEDTQFLSLIDNQSAKSLRVLYKTVFKKKGIVQMIGMNQKEFYKICERLKEKRFARRIVFCAVQQPFLVNINVNIQNNIQIQKNYNIKNNQNKSSINQKNKEINAFL